MKKNVLRVISLVLVAGMLFAFASCTQEIHVRFVDKDGNDIDIGGLANVVNQGTSSNSSTQSTTPPANNTTPPANTTPSTNETPSQPAGETPSQPAGETPSQPAADTPAQSTGMPSTTAEICEFYKKGVADIKAGNAGYTKKEWQKVYDINVGASIINKAIEGVLGNFMTVEADADEQLSDKGSDQAKDRIAEWKLTDLSQVASATCVNEGGNYKITIIMKDENTPKKQGSVLGQVTGSLLYWEDIENTLKGDGAVTAILKEFRDIQVIYKAYQIDAVMTPDGKFVSIDHTANVDILIGYAKLVVGTIENGSGKMNNYCKYYNFVY